MREHHIVAHLCQEAFAVVIQGVAHKRQSVTLMNADITDCFKGVRIRVINSTITVHIKITMTKLHITTQAVGARKEVVVKLHVVSMVNIHTLLVLLRCLLERGLVCKCRSLDKTPQHKEES